MTIRPARKTPRLQAPHFVALGVAVLVIAVPLLGRGFGARPQTPTAPKRAAVATATAAASPTPAPTAPKAAASKPKPAPAKPVAAKPSVDVYRGLGSWVDIYDDRAWANPAAAVADMARHGVKTLYLETGNSKAPTAVKDPAKVAAFIEAAHAHKMKIVAWYLPDLTNVQHDYDRVAQAIRFHSRSGQSFDSFTLDIESPAVTPVAERNRRLLSLSSRMRVLAGKTYPLGACIPSPVGIQRNGSWPTFPYAQLAKTYDVFVPMSYYTWHGKGEKAAYADTAANMRILRSQPGCAKTPVHLIGGLAEESTWDELRGFVRAGKATGAIGASLYTWTGTTTPHWTQLEEVK